MRLTFIGVLALLLAVSTSFWTYTAALPAFTFFTKKPDQLQQKKFGSDQTLVAALPSAINGHSLSTAPVPSVDKDTLARFRNRQPLETTYNDNPSGRGARSARLLYNPAESKRHDEPPNSNGYAPGPFNVPPVDEETKKRFERRPLANGPNRDLYDFPRASGLHPGNDRYSGEWTANQRSERLPPVKEDHNS